MQKAAEQLAHISDLISQDVGLAEKELKAFCNQHKKSADSYVTAKVNLLQMLIDVIRDVYVPNEKTEQQILNYFEKKGLYDDAATVLLTKTRHYFVKGNVADAEVVLGEMEKRFWDKISLKCEIIYLTRVSFLLMKKNEVSRQLEVCLQALAKLEQVEDRGIWYNNNYTIFACYIACIYLEILEFDSALPYLQASLKLVEAGEVALYNKWNVYHFFQEYYYCLKEMAKCIEWAEKQIEILKSDTGYANLLNLTYISGAQMCYLYLRDYKLNDKDRAHYLDKQRAFVLSSKQLKGDEKSDNREKLLPALARLEYQSGNYELAAYYIEEFKKYVQKTKQVKMVWQCYREAHYIYFAWGKQTNDPAKLTKAYEYLLSERTLTEEEARITSKQKMDAVTAQFELKQRELSEKLMEQEIYGLKKEVQSISLNLHEKIQVLDDLKVYVKSLKKKELEVGALVATIAKKIDSVKITEQDKATLQHKMSEVNQKLFAILSAKYPALSNLEINLCALFQTGMTNKELSKLYGQGEKSYEQQRYRIKKKMGLTAKDNLVKHLVQLNTTT
jgi:DNA-binding CsgD family transcriptional regulator